MKTFAAWRLCARTLYTGCEEWLAQRRKDAKEDEFTVIVDSHVLDEPKFGIL
ncbi:MAG: hypothetical protein NTW21_02515 [Verrucomicrobia bacterium]|nr:hypothetical protein [Verrucomicrobiota bacterium]